MNANAAGDAMAAEAERWADLFEPGDPRAGPFTDEDFRQSRRYCADPKRLHYLKRNIDWMAVRLQHGRGCAVSELVTMFGISESAIYQRVREEKWVQPMAEADRRDLAKWVWLAGIERVAMEEEITRRSLIESSDWSEIERPYDVWKPAFGGGARRSMILNTERVHDERYPDDAARRAEHEAVRRDLAHLRAFLESGGEDANADRAGENCGSMADDGHGQEGSPSGADDLAAVGPSRPASA